MMNILIDGHNIRRVGGIERFTVQLANAMTQRGHRVFLLTYAPEGASHVFTLNPNVRLVHYLHTGDQSYLPLLRRQIQDCEPDVLVSPASHNNHLLWCAILDGTEIPWVYSEHNDPSVIENEFWNAAERTAVLCAADRLHFLLDGYRAAMPDSVQERACFIPHAVDIPRSIDERPPDGERTLLAVGRLAEQKQYIPLIQSFALLTRDFPQWRLKIWGEGEERVRLQRRIASLGLQGRASLCGLTSEPERQYAAADLFCIPSRYEGFGIVVIEAMAHALPVVGFAGCAALNSLIRHGETGLLAPEMTARSLAAALRSLMENTNLRRRMGGNARTAAMEYAPERIFDAWETLLGETAACKGRTALHRCSAGDGGDRETVKHAALLRALLQRKDVLLKDGWLRDLVRRFPKFRKRLWDFRRHMRRIRPVS
jgi:glycosyltransferase involved in cell wall biosynthesis